MRNNLKRSVKTLFLLLVLCISVFALPSSASANCRELYRESPCNSTRESTNTTNPCYTTTTPERAASNTLSNNSCAVSDTENSCNSTSTRCDSQNQSNDNTAFCFADLYRYLLKLCTNLYFPDGTTDGSAQSSNPGSSDKLNADDFNNILSPVQPDNNSNIQASEYAEEVLKMVIEQRVANGLSELVMDESLLVAAEIRAEEITRLFSHTRPDGSSCFTALDEANVQYQAAGENLAI